MITALKRFEGLENEISGSQDPEVESLPIGSEKVIIYSIWLRSWSRQTFFLLKRWQIQSKLNWWFWEVKIQKKESAIELRKNSKWSNSCRRCYVLSELSALKRLLIPRRIPNNNPGWGSPSNWCLPYGVDLRRKNKLTHECVLTDMRYLVMTLLLGF